MANAKAAHAVGLRLWHQADMPKQRRNVRG
jgi:hypothetical protein